MKQQYPPVTVLIMFILLLLTMTPLVYSQITRSSTLSPFCDVNCSPARNHAAEDAPMIAPLNDTKILLSPECCLPLMEHYWYTPQQTRALAQCRYLSDLQTRRMNILC